MSAYTGGEVVYYGYNPGALKCLGFCPPVVLVAAHPDDEVLGAGGLLASLGGCTVIHITDGAPRRMKPGALGFGTPGEYAAARRKELLDALAFIPSMPRDLIDLGVHDLEASLNLEGITKRLLEIFRTIRPGTVLTHPYEGGHPDHDSAAFAVRTALDLMEKEDAPRARHIEFTSYHAFGGKMVTSRFLPSASIETKFILSNEERARKDRMIRAFESQARALKVFSAEFETFREAPEYDFNAPPHPGRLFYEGFDWGVTGGLWRKRAAKAMEAIAPVSVRPKRIEVPGQKARPVQDLLEYFRFTLGRLF